MLKSPLSQEQINNTARTLFAGHEIIRSVWDKLSDSDKIAVNNEIERLEEEVNETSKTFASDEAPSTQKV